MIAGISADKIAKAERWGVDSDKDDGQRPRWLEMMTRLMDATRSATVTISVDSEPREAPPASGVTAVLGEPPIDSAAAAIRASIMAGED